MQAFIFTSDLHFTDRPRDDYRFNVFQHLKEEILRLKECHDEVTVFLLGDITDKKDCHTGKLLTRIVNEIVHLSQHAKVEVVMGNHDYTDPHESSLNILGHLPNVEFHMSPILKSIDNKLFAILPHSRTPKQAFEAFFDTVTNGVKRKFDFVLLHQCIEGSVSDSGQELDGLNLALFSPFHIEHMIAGDIHVPQRVGALTYCGAPYPIHFGDDHDTRFLVYELQRKGGPRKLMSRPIPSITKSKIRASSIEDLEIQLKKIRKGDQYKIEFVSSGIDTPLAAEAVAKLVGKAKGLCAGLSIVSDQDSQAIPDGRSRSDRDDSEIFDDYCKGTDVPKNTRTAGRKMM